MCTCRQWGLVGSRRWVQDPAPPRSVCTHPWVRRCVVHHRHPAAAVPHPPSVSEDTATSFLQQQNKCSTDTGLSAPTVSLGRAIRMHLSPPGEDPAHGYPAPAPAPAPPQGFSRHFSPWAAVAPWAQVAQRHTERLSIFSTSSRDQYFYCSERKSWGLPLCSIRQPEPRCCW